MQHPHPISPSLPLSLSLSKISSMASSSSTSLIITAPLSPHRRRVSFKSRFLCSISTTHRSPVEIKIVQDLGRAGAVALVAASLFLADPAIAFIGGGPYGQGVTRGQDLSGKDFSGKSLIKQDFKTSILRQANFRGAKLLGASFFDADLTGADLSDADLRGADLSLANFTKANLTNVNLEGALATGNTSFRGSIINGADFTDVPLREDQRGYLCKMADGVNPTTGNTTRETLLCN